MPNVDLVKSDVIISGNLNTNMMSNSKLPKNDKHELLNFLGTFDLTQLIKEPTWITDTSRALIDLIFVNNDHRVVKSGSGSAEWSLLGVLHFESWCFY